MINEEKVHYKGQCKVCDHYFVLRYNDKDLFYSTYDNPTGWMANCPMCKFKVNMFEYYENDDNIVKKESVVDLKKYVLGFLFNSNNSNDDNRIIWLIKKNRPEWQAGKLNAIGGKLELNELPIQAMEREFKEETGLEIKSNDWKLFCKLEGNCYEVYCYYAFSDLIPKTITDEEIIWFLVKYLPDNTIPNLRWLIPMALSFQKGETAKNFIVKEILL